MVTMKQATEASHRIEADLSSALGPKLEGVRGVAVTWDDKGELCVRVDVEQEYEGLIASKLPDRIDGVRVALSTDRARRVVGYDSAR